MEAITETLQTPVRDRADVIVSGGGIAGVAAAVAARRQGMDVILVERTALFGGLATNGLISWYEPLCDGYGTKMIAGLAEELLRLSIRYGPDTLPEAWREAGAKPDKSKMLPMKHDPLFGRYATHFSPTMFQLALDELLEKEGVRVYLCTGAARALMGEGQRCLGIAAESVSGREVYLAGAVIDATGAASLLHGAGVPCVDGANYFTFIAHTITGKAADNALERRKWLGKGADLHGNGHPEGMPHPAGVTNREETAYLLAGRQALLEDLKKGDRMANDIAALPQQAQFRKIRRLSGGYTLTEKDCCVHHASSVALLSDFERAGDWYEMPFECLYHPDWPNLLAAGRMVSAAGWAWDVARVIPACAATGEAAGIAAAMAVKSGRALKDLDIAALQSVIRERGGLVFRTDAQ